MSLSCYNSSSPYSTPTLTLLPTNLFSIELFTATPDHVSPLLRTHSELPCPCTKSTSLNMAHRALGPGTLLRNLPHLMPNSQSLHSRHIYLFLIFSHMSSFVPPPFFSFPYSQINQGCNAAGAVQILPSGAMFGIKHQTRKQTPFLSSRIPCL